MSKKRLLSIVVSAVILLSFACTAMAAEKSERYVGDSTVNGSIYQTYYQVDAQTRTGVKKISVSGVLYEKGILRPLAIPMDGAKPLPEVPVDKWSLLYISAS